MNTPKTHLFALLIALSFSGLALTACDNEVKGNKAEVAEPSEPVAEDTTKPEEGAAVVEDGDKKPEAGAAQEVMVNAAESKIQFVGAKVTGKHEGGFKDFEGKLKVGADGSLEMVAFTVKTDSVYSDNDKLTGHLKSPDFFDTAKNPEAKFESTAITAGSEMKTDDGKAYTHTVVGNMTLNGVTKQLTFPAMVESSGDSITASTAFVFDRNDFNITYKGQADDLIKPDVKMIIELQAPKPS